MEHKIFAIGGPKMGKKIQEIQVLKFEAVMLGRKGGRGRNIPRKPVTSVPVRLCEDWDHECTNCWAELWVTEQIPTLKVALVPGFRRGKVSRAILNMGSISIGCWNSLPPLELPSLGHWHHELLPLAVRPGGLTGERQCLRVTRT